MSKDTLIRVRVLPLNVPNHRPKAGLELCGTSLHPLHLTRMGIAALLPDEMLRFPFVGLAQRNVPLLSRLHQTLPGTIIQLRIGRKTNILPLYRGVHIDTGKLEWFYRLEL